MINFIIIILLCRIMMITDVAIIIASHVREEFQPLGAVGRHMIRCSANHTPNAAKPGDLWATVVAAAAAGGGAGGGSNTTCCVLALTTVIQWLE